MTWVMPQSNGDLSGVPVVCPICHQVFTIPGDPGGLDAGQQSDGERTGSGTQRESCRAARKPFREGPHKDGQASQEFPISGCSDG